MSSVVQESYSDQYIHMKQLSSRFTTKIQEYNMSDELATIIPYASLRMRNITQLSHEECANAIVNHLQSSNKFMLNDPMSEQFRIETIKAMPHCLSVKRSVKSQLLTTVGHMTKAKSIGYCKWLKYNISLKFMKMWMAIQNLSLTIEFWHQTIKTIQSHSGSGIATYFKFLRWLLFLNIIPCILSISFIVIPQSFDKTHLPKDIKILDFFTGNGFLSHTMMYYGFYTNNTINTSFGLYSIPSAYFLTLLFCYVHMFIILSIKVISSYRRCYVETRGNLYDFYSNKIFCGWDFSISSPKTAVLQSASIYKELEELLIEMRQHVPLHWFDKCILIIVQFGVTVFVIFLICGTSALVWLLLDHFNTETIAPFSMMIVPTIITIIIHIFPTIISYLVSLEHYNNKRTELYVTVIKNYAVATMIIGTLFAFWIINSASECWQTKLGEEIYRLILLDFIFSIFGACLQFTRSRVYDIFHKKVGRPEFNIARDTLNLMYNQTLFWMGFYFSPLISFIIVIKLILTFYVKKYELKKCYQQSAKPWRAAQTQTLFLALTFVSMIGVMITIGYIVTYVESNDCGPFRNYYYTWDFIIDGILLLKKDSMFWTIISELSRPGIGAVILISMCIVVYCLRAKVQASKEMLKILSEMLLLQSQDKQFLMKNFVKLANERSHCETSTSMLNKTDCAEHTQFSVQNYEKDKNLLSRRNLPSTSFEQR